MRSDFLFFCRYASELRGKNFYCAANIFFPIIILFIFTPCFIPFLFPIFSAKGYADNLTTYSVIAGVWSCGYSLGWVITNYIYRRLLTLTFMVSTKIILFGRDMTGPAFGGVLLEYFDYPTCTTVMAIISLTMVRLYCRKTLNTPKYQFVLELEKWKKLYNLQNGTPVTEKKLRDKISQTFFILTDVLTRTTNHPSSQNFWILLSIHFQNKG